jgi:hypothetical protein
VTADPPAPVDPAGASRRAFTAALLACAAGAGLVLFAASRTWSVTVQRRAAPLPPVSVVHSGGGLLAWLPAVALVGLAGAGALVATKRAARTVVGGLLVLVGLGLAAGGADGLRLAAAGDRAWPVAVVIGGAAVVWSGWRALRHGRTWPAMGSRYDRAGAPPARARADRGDAGLWDDIDRGVDPTIQDA